MVDVKRLNLPAERDYDVDLCSHPEDTGVGGALIR